jgi:Serine dehydrogenase proteinase
MGIYSEYLDKNMPFDDLTKERKKQLARIAQVRGRDVLVYASASNKASQGAPVALDNSDLLPINDQLSNLNGQAIDVLLETGGGSGETAEDIVRILYLKYGSVAFIVPGMAKSAGTIMVMAGDEILMEPGSSSLGPIDAQIQWEGKVFSAEAFLKGLERIKEEVTQLNSLNRAYIPILQRISPGEIQNAENALSFAKELVTKWLQEHKFQKWNVHRAHNPGTPVTAEEKAKRAREIADNLCNHSEWLSHGRSIKMTDLQSIGLEITDYSKNQELSDGIRRYLILLQMTFDTTSIYKIIETPQSQIYRFTFNQQIQIAGLPGIFPVPPGAPAGGKPGAQPIQPPIGQPTGAMIQFACTQCKRVHTLQADFDSEQPLQPSTERFPANDVLICNQCHASNNVVALRRQVELQTKRKVHR